MLQVQSSKFGFGVGPNSSFLYRTVSVLLKHITVRAIALMNVKFLSILQKIHTLSILHTQFYKTPTLVCLFYYLFYLNNHFSHFFYYSSQLPFNPSENSLSLHSWRHCRLHGWNLVTSTIRQTSSLPQAPIHRDSFQLTQKL